MHEYKVVILGSGGVGKSAITLRFVEGKFIEKYDPTIEDCYKKEVDIDGQYYTLEILDTAGTEQFRSLRDVYIKTGDAFVVVYSITSVASFNDIQEILEQIQLVRSEDKPPIVIVGNKCDLEQDRIVEDKQGTRFANYFNCTFIESSAKQSININEIFYDIIRQFKRKPIKNNNKTNKLPNKTYDSYDVKYTDDNKSKNNTNVTDEKKDKKFSCCETCTFL